MKPVARVPLTVVAIGFLIQTWVRARNPSRKEVSSGNKPIEGVATAVAALIAVGVLIRSGLRALNAYNQAIDRGARPIEGVATTVVAFIGLTPGGPLNK
jgi:heme/copper-type cytochrome/quinol oxidase subunit 2